MMRNILAAIQNYQAGLTSTNIFFWKSVFIIYL